MHRLDAGQPAQVVDRLAGTCTAMPGSRTWYDRRWVREIRARLAASVTPRSALPTASRAWRTRSAGRLGLVRRNKSRADGDGAGTPADGEPLPRQDAGFVDWVTRLGKPVADNEPHRESGRRSLRG
ncbi:hypothetical protein AB0I37_26225 [Micromonospora purpureochromogenes]|uniref:hypothetical protein n=1 Tax=Micromonospora purpureochromogenes TaxID=47872 RepID=UPI0033C2C03D